jgi:hypothetical protein
VRRCLAAILLLTAIPANAQQLDSQSYRTGLPPVMTPMGDQAPIDNRTVERFRQAYAARKSPRIMAFWNRELDDRVSSAGSVETHVEQRDVGVGLAVPGGIVWGRDRDTVVRSHVIEPETTRRPNFAEPSKWAFEAAFFQAFSEAGVSFIDRGMAIRTTDQGWGEMAGVAGKADLLMEILVTRDHRSPAGTAFKVTVKEIYPVQGVVPPLAHTGETGVIARVPADVVSAPPTDVSATKPASPQAHYDATVRRGQFEEANRIGLGAMTGSAPCGAPGGVITPPTTLSKPCVVEPLDDFSLRHQRR